MSARCDVLVVGGGINGTGIARDLAGRGLSVVLVEQDDLAAHTSSASTKLIHGGLRYLEHGEFVLVRKALKEREVLLRSAPHIMRPLRIVMPHHPDMRAAWMIRIGLFLYDHLARRVVLPGSRVVNLRRYGAGSALKDEYTRGYVYSDGWVDDARLVVLNAIDARERGANIYTRCLCVRAERGAEHWSVELQGRAGTPQRIEARALVNAAGPWAEAFLRERTRAEGAAAPTARALRLVKGSHIVVPRCFRHDHAYLFQSTDGRVVFAIPYEHDYTLIGTTDVEVQGDPRGAAADEAEIAYLCEQASRYFKRPLRAEDVVWSYAGVRPLLDDDEGNPAAVTRDYLLDADGDAGAPLLSVWGGKITTFRRLAEEAGDRLCGLLGERRPCWTAGALLPGGDLSAWIGKPRRPDTDFERFVVALGRRHGWLPMALARRLARAYGSRVERVLGSARAIGDLGAEIAPGLYEAELRYLCREEWAEEGDDVLWRRSKRGLHCSAAEQQRVHEYMRSTTATPLI